MSQPALVPAGVQRIGLATPRHSQPRRLVHMVGINGSTAPVQDYDVASIVTKSSLAGRFGGPNRIAHSTTRWGLVDFSKLSPWTLVRSA